MKRLMRLALLLLCVFLDTAALPRVRLWGIAPSLLFAFLAACTLACSVQEGILLAAMGGLAADLICNTTIGPTPALFILALLVLWTLGKGRVLKPLFLFLTVSALYFAIQFSFAAGASLFGHIRPYGRELLLMQLPSALLTGAVAAGFEKLLKERRRIL